VTTDEECALELVPVPWDSEFFGFPIARLVGQPDPATLPTLARHTGVRCAYYSCSADDAVGIGAAEQSRFRLADVRLVLASYLSGIALDRPAEPSRALELDVARPGDLADLRLIAAELSVHSRFACDPGFGRVQARRLYDRWLDVSLDGRADPFIVARDTTRVLGFVTCRTEDGTASLELVAVRKGAEGGGVGTALVRRACRDLEKRGHQQVRVATQGRNLRAVRFYERCGFHVMDISLVYHRWFDIGP
jgi:ribosomal protein S18 acetylase RimI-like enzyme